MSMRLSEPCMCGDIRCPTCGPQQGNNRCHNCGKWDDEGGCDDRKACDKAIEQDEQKMLSMEVAETIRDAFRDDFDPPQWAKDKARFCYSESERGFWVMDQGWGAFRSENVAVHTIEEEGAMNLPYTGIGMDCRWVGYEEALTLPDDSE